MFPRVVPVALIAYSPTGVDDHKGSQCPRKVEANNHRRTVQGKIWCNSKSFVSVNLSGG